MACPNFGSHGSHFLLFRSCGIDARREIARGGGHVRGGMRKKLVRYGGNKAIGLKSEIALIVYLAKGGGDRIPIKL